MGKKFLIIGNQNAITYKEIFPFVKNGQLWLGIQKPDIFTTPSGEQTEKLAGLTRWFTNLMSDYERKQLALTKRYDPDKYKKYDNYDAIEVSRTVDIPVDYDGVIGVPITYIQYHCQDQFEIVGIDRYVEDNPNYGHRFNLNNKEVYARILIRRKAENIGQKADNGTISAKSPIK